MMSLIVTVIALGILAYIANRFLGTTAPKGRHGKAPTQFHYGKKTYLMTKSEHEFFNLLVGAAGNDYFVFPQVHLSSIIDHKVTGQSWKAALYHINSKSVDYVICEKMYIKPLVAIELDDWSHEREDRQARDIEVERILKEAELPLVRFSNPKQLTAASVANQLSSYLLK